MYQLRQLMQRSSIALSVWFTAATFGLFLPCTFEIFTLVLKFFLDSFTIKNSVTCASLDRDLPPSLIFYFGFLEALSLVII